MLSIILFSSQIRKHLCHISSIIAQKTLERDYSVSLGCHGFRLSIFSFRLRSAGQYSSVSHWLFLCVCSDREHHKKILVDLFHYDSSSAQQQQQLCRASVAPSNERERKKNLITNRSLIISLCSYIYHIQDSHLGSIEEGGGQLYSLLWSWSKLTRLPLNECVCTQHQSPAAGQTNESAEEPLSLCAVGWAILYIREKSSNEWNRSCPAAPLSLSYVYTAF